MSLFNNISMIIILGKKMDKIFANIIILPMLGYFKLFFSLFSLF
jgi:hypothetical protein